MRPPCEYVVRFILPRLRAKIADVLINKYNWTQKEVANKLKITQAAVSKYRSILKSRTLIPSEIIDKTAIKLANRIAKNEISSVEFIFEICKLCFKLRIDGAICHLHKKIIPQLSEERCNVCSLIIQSKELEIDERVEVLDNVKRSVLAVIGNHNFAKIIPEVRMNIVMAIRGAKTIEDVAGVPGRITVVKDKPYAILSPEFGASKHLALILLTIMKYRKDIRAAMCIKYDDKVDSALKKCRFKVEYIKRKRGKFLKILERKMRSCKVKPDIIVDLGEKGIEPITYIFGESAMRVVEKGNCILREIG